MVGRLLGAGDVVLAIGPLGSGKTTFVQGLARGVGFAGDVTSPTFNLCHTYRGRIDVVHVDLWRLDRYSEILDLALEEEIDHGAALVVEWGEAADALLGEQALVVQLEPSRFEGERAIAIEARGPWMEREGAMGARLAEATL